MIAFSFTAKVVKGQVRIPRIERHHCAGETAQSRTVGGFWNAPAMFKGIVNGVMTKRGIGPTLDLSDLPEGFTAVRSGMFAEIVARIPD